MQLYKSLTLLTIFSIFFAQEQSLASVKLISNTVSVRYIHGWTDINGDIQSAVQFKLNPGWKTYWRNPGLFGIEPNFDWTGSMNIKNIEFSWPTPQIFDQYDVKVIGYKNVLTIPIKITKKVPFKKGFLNLKLEFGVCADICLIEKAEINEQLKSQDSKENSNVITTALKKVPGNITDKVLSLSECSININDKELTVGYSINLIKVPNSKPAMIIEYAFSDKYLENQTSKLEGRTLYAKASLKNIHEAEGIIERNRLTALLILENEGFKIDGCD